ncbi:hypothetical protein SSX86_028095 [Deinandra increscens subsp. villosa]|uniref:Uncharacterized protein n=1 Tax=Deinandra increscens subsp. villosa TaxID=3103831 RepID=A0AAP0CA53_9ASTR
MRCKKHITDLSSIHGVCASCLRQRLHRVIVAQEQAEAQSLAQNRCNLNSNPNPNPSFPRSVSPYENRQKSDNNTVNSVAAGVQRANNKPRLNHSLSDQRFYNSPLIAVNTRGCIGGDSISSNKKKKSLIRFSSFSNLFRSNGSRDGDADSKKKTIMPILKKKGTKMPI